jgi:L-alanine-DL-glutamate epimerase-like enolase superfamily enzyme
MSEPHRIARIEVIAFTIEVAQIGADPGGSGIFYDPGGGTSQVRFAVRITTESGHVGEYVPPRGRARVIKAHVEALAPRLVGQPALAREAHYQSMRKATRHVGEVGIGALDIALWDLAGKIHDAPIYRLLGGYRTRLPAYASTLAGDRHPDGLSSPEAYADFAEHCLQRGFRAYKMHGWKEGQVQEEVAMIRAVGDRVGGRMGLMYDSACNLKTFADAVMLGRVCDEYGYLWLEDPFADGGISIHAHRKLRELIRTPLLITEHVKNPEANADILVSGATDFARADPDYDGGITGCLKIARTAESLGMDCEVHACGPAMRHLMAALRNSNYYELNLVHPRTRNAWHLPVYLDGYADELESIDADGCVSVPDGPGLGVRYDWHAIDTSTIERHVFE